MKIPSLLLPVLVALAPLSAGADQPLVRFDGGIGAIPVSAGVGTVHLRYTRAADPQSVQPELVRGGHPEVRLQPSMRAISASTPCSKRRAESVSEQLRMKLAV
jgi:hypothetical protein